MQNKHDDESEKFKKLHPNSEAVFTKEADLTMPWPSLKISALIRLCFDYEIEKNNKHFQNNLRETSFLTILCSALAIRVTEMKVRFKKCSQIGVFYLRLTLVIVNTAETL